MQLISKFLVPTLVFAIGVSTFPAVTLEKLERDGGESLGLKLTHGGGLLNGTLQPLTGALSKIEIPVPQPQGLKKIPGGDPNHQFQAPGPTDVRGDCPTLHTLANHGYLSRNGITSFAEATNNIQVAYGYTYGLAAFVSALGLLAGGDLLTGKFSIGGADSRVPNTLGPALGLDKHGSFESDGSVSRKDLYFGSNADFIENRWEGYVNTSKNHGGLFGKPTQVDDLQQRYHESRSTNPEFTASVIYFFVSAIERVFVYEGLPNGTNQAVADYANIAPFFLNETFPENWFRRGSPYSLPQTFTEALSIHAAGPVALGQNQGLNNFVPLDTNISQSTPGELGCFALTNVFDIGPGQFTSDLYDLWSGFFTGMVAPFFVDDGFFNCDLSSFVAPGANAGIAPNGSVSASGSPVNGAYPGIGFIPPGSS